MKQNPLSKGVMTENFIGIGTVSREMVRVRACELALIEGRDPLGVTHADYEQAKRELTGGSDMDRQQMQLDSIPESERWDPVPGSTGHKTEDSPTEDEDEEGRSETEQLVDQGVAEAEHDQMLQAARDAAKKDSRER